MTLASGIQREHGDGTQVRPLYLESLLICLHPLFFSIFWFTSSTSISCSARYWPGVLIRGLRYREAMQSIQISEGRMASRERLVFRYGPNFWYRRGVD